MRQPPVGRAGRGQSAGRSAQQCDQRGLKGGAGQIPCAELPAAHRNNVRAACAIHREHRLAEADHRIIAAFHRGILAGERARMVLRAWACEAACSRTVQLRQEAHHEPAEVSVRGAQQRLAQVHVHLPLRTCGRMTYKPRSSPKLRQAFQYWQRHVKPLTLDRAVDATQPSVNIQVSSQVCQMCVTSSIR